MMERLMLFREFIPDLLAFVGCAVLVGMYYLFLRRKIRENPTYTIHRVNEVARGLWVTSVMGNAGKDVMAVQTLRNFVMGASLMASTAALLIMGTLTLSGQADNLSRSWHLLNLTGSHSPEIWILKVLCLLVDFIVAFFSFAMCVRLNNHVVFMLNVPDSSRHHSFAPSSVARRLNRAGNLFAVGMRAFFFAIPLVFWLFGPILLVTATVGLLIALYYLDRSESEATAVET
jgi:uncharacterized membrane protein